MNTNDELTLMSNETLAQPKKEVMDIGKLMDMSNFLANSTIVPVQYQNRPENCFIALDMASRMGVSPMMVMQNLFIVQGKPSFSGQAIAAMIKSHPQLTNVELHFVGTPNTDSYGAYVTAKHLGLGGTLTGSTVTIAIAKKEGWYGKNGSKWQTMPELMLSYRAYAWFGRVYLPETMMGLQSTEEVWDVVASQKEEIKNPYEDSAKTI